MRHEALERLFSLDDKVVVITGGGGSIAGTMAKVIAQCGAKAAVLDLDRGKAQRVVDAIVEKSGQAITLECDVTNKNSLEECRNRVIRNFGKIDCLINGAGGNNKEATTTETLSFFDMPTEANKQVFDLNFMGTLLPCQIFGKEIAKQSFGSIVNIASIAGFRPLTRAVAYAAAKAAVINFTRWLSVYMAKKYSRDIRVNAIVPGFCATEQNRYLLFDEKGELTKRGKAILDAAPQSRLGEPAEFVGAAIWLLSDSGSFATGSLVTIDGGFDAFSGV